MTLESYGRIQIDRGTDAYSPNRSDASERYDEPAACTNLVRQDTANTADGRA